MLHKGLCLYRELRVSSILIPVDGNEMDDEEEHDFGPLARVFQRRHHECCSDVSSYYYKEYPSRDYVVKHSVKSYCALPIFESIRQQACIGVLEILSTSTHDSLLCDLNYELQKKNLTYLYKPLVSLRDFKYLEDTERGYKVMKDICRGHKLEFAQIWVACSATGCIERLSSYYNIVVPRKDNFSVARPKAYQACTMWEGKGVVGKAFSSRGACFCNDISKLSIHVEPFALIARKLGLARCFAVCLQSTRADDIFYIVDFSWPSSGIDYGDPRNFLSMLKTKIESSMGDLVQKLGEKLFVEVVKISSDNDLDSFEICDTSHIRSTLGSKVTRGKRNGIGKHSERQPSSPFSVQEVGLGVQLNYSEVESNSPSTVQEMSLGLDLGVRPLNSIRDNTAVQPNPPSSDEEMTFGVHLGLRSRLEPKEDTRASSSVRNYSVVQRRSSAPGTSQFISNTDSDFIDINAALQILRRAKRRRGMLTFDLSNG